MRLFSTVTDYHVHTERGPYTIAWLEEFVKVAKKAGVTDLGISEHAYRFHQTRHLLWNPWVDKSQRLADFGDEEYVKMLCIESANVRPRSVELAASETHELEVSLESVRLDG